MWTERIGPCRRGSRSHDANQEQVSCQRHCTLIMRPMQKSHVKLRRRPLLVPLLLPVALLIVIVVTVAWFLDARATTVVIVARHAETETSGDPDPALSLAGRERAARLSRVLSQARPVRGLDAIFASEMRRTQQTALPVSEMLGLPVSVRPMDAWKRLPRLILSEHRGEYVLVVGHTNTIPPLVQALSGESVTVAGDEYDALFVVFVPRFSQPRLLRLRY